jgi:cytosine permease
MKYIPNQFVLFGFNVVISSILVGGAIGMMFPPRLSLLIVLFAALSNCLVATLIGSLASRTGYSAVLIYRFSFGRLGTIWPNFVMAFTGIIWFALIAEISRDAMMQTFGWTFGPFGVLLLTLGIGVLFVIPAYRSIKWVSYVSDVLVPILLIIVVYVLVRSIQEVGGWKALMAIDTAPKVPLLIGFSMAAAGWLQGATVSADFTRFFKNGKQAVGGTVMSFGVIIGLQYFGGAIGAAVTGEWNLFLMLQELGGGWLPFIAVFIAAWSTEQAIMYGASLQVAGPPVPMFYKDQESTRRLTVIILYVIGMVLAMIGVTPVFNLWLIFLASIVGPIAAIVIIDYWAFPERQLIYEDGSDPDRTVNVRALACWAAGFLVGHFTAKYNVFCPVLNAMIITGILYYFITRQEMNARKMKRA